jgi:hypothetical protein
LAADHASNVADTEDVRNVIGKRKRFWEKLGPGFAASVGLHVVAVVGLILALGYTAIPDEMAVIIPVDIVRLADNIVSPPQPRQAAVPQQQAAPQASPDAKPIALTPAQTRPPPDDLEIKLSRLAELREPLVDQDFGRKSEGLSRQNATRADAASGSEAAIKDFLRDQIEHHWNPDLATLHGRNISVQLRVAITRTGVITAADLINARESGIDPAYDEAAMSARDAALLSSPLTLPPGQYPASMDLILSVNTRDALR